MSYPLLRITSISILAILFFSCSKNEDSLLPSASKGSIYGSVKLFDRFADEIIAFSDIIIELIDSVDQSVTIYPDSAGIFRIDNFTIGQLVFKIDKPGYNGLNSFYFNNTSALDTIPEIMLFEEVPFSFKEYSAEYIEQYGYERVKWEIFMDYETTEKYQVGQILLFSPVQDVSANNYTFSLHGGDYFANISGIKEGYRGYSRAGFIEHGFQKGQTVYTTCYAINTRFKHYFWMIEHYFDIISFKLNNPSNVDSFIFDW